VSFQVAPLLGSVFREEAGNATSVRYYIPLLLGTLPTALGLAERALRGTRLGDWAPTAAALAVAALFGGSMKARLAQATTSGSTLAFTFRATQPEYLAYCREALRPSRADALLEAALAPWRH
jgi:hypothetical protein